MFSDNAIALVAEIFPCLEKLDLDGGRVTVAGLKLLERFHKLRFLSIYCGQVSELLGISINSLR